MSKSFPHPNPSPGGRRAKSATSNFLLPSGEVDVAGLGEAAVVFPLPEGEGMRVRESLDRASSGFTLVELLVVVVIISITLTLVVVNFRPDDKRVLSYEAQRVGLLLEHAHDEAVTSSQRLAWVADDKGYRFAVATGPDAWKELAGDDIFHARQWSSGVSFGGVRLPQNAASGW